MTRFVCVAILCLGVAGTGCDRKSVVTAPVQKSSSVSRLVFVDQVECCPCTSDRINASWQALASVNKGHDALPVERIHADTEPEQVKDATGKYR